MLERFTELLLFEKYVRSLQNQLFEENYFFNVFPLNLIQAIREYRKRDSKPFGILR